MSARRHRPGPMKLALPLVALLMLAAPSCNPQPGMGEAPPEAAPAATPDTRPVVILPDGTRVLVELATDDDTRAYGLMFRESIAPDRGMLFLFTESGPHSFWMKNTLIPLDMLWLDERGVIAGMKQNVPPCQADPCPSYDAGVPAKYILELGGGVAARHGLKVGDRLEIRNIEGVIVR